ncbi:hypothetical protein [Marivirga arenosa]|uniref:Outer membrane protein beta-barrel domain-containing protein n=1 Tax=Marivirga arenosa TaxID=3059076 RepID=A0AA49JA21_9BACT|nr:hypothetical protein [Marivirga sp. BKB1-2]WKK79655.2 hypothetical protein QYS47_20295 [Marivirga sp. BKB1-2]
MLSKLLPILIFTLFSITVAAQEEAKVNSISYFAGSGFGGHDMLPGKHHYVGIDQSIWKFVYASAQVGIIHATNKRYFELDDISLDEHSYNLMMQYDVNLRIKLGPITITPHVGLIGRYSDEVRYLHGSNQPPETPIEDFLSYRKVAFSGLSYGKAVGVNFEFMIFDHTSFGVRTDIQEYNNNPTSLSTYAFQIRTNIQKLINEFKK